MDISLEDLYMPPSHRAHRITPANVLSVLPAACFLELRSLAKHCVDTLIDALSTDSIIDYAVRLESLRPPTRSMVSPYGNKHEYSQLFGQCYTQLSDAILNFLCGVINAGLCADKEDEGAENSRTDGEPRPDCDNAMWAENLLAKLPLCWVRRVLESDLLCVANEFERYELVKRVVKMRRVVPRSEEAVLLKEEDVVDEEDGLDDVDVSMWSEPDTSSSVSSSRRASRTSDVVTRNAIAAEGVFRLRSYVGSLLGRVVSSGGGSGVPLQTAGTDSRKRKRGLSEENETPSGSEDDFVEAVEEITSPRSPLARRNPILHTPSRSGTPTRKAYRIAQSGPGASSSIVHTHFGPGKLPPSANASPEDTVMAGIFQTAVVYTYMTFPQLEVVKKDGIVPDAVVLESFWMQAELMNGGAGLPAGGRGFGKFRFAVRFRDVAEYFQTCASGGKTQIREVVDVETAGGPSGSGSTAAKKKKIMISESIVCAGLQYRVLLSLAEEEEGDELASPSPSTDGRGSRPPRSRPLLRALLQRNRLGEPKRSRGNVGAAAAAAAVVNPSISYRICVFNPDDFASEARNEDWKRFVEPVTKCDFDGNGFVRGFREPTATGRDRQRRAQGLGDGADEGSVWAIVMIDFK
ncbi:hypothetical protein HKX48_005212 [Thoreauomyces humboldtii]|nr:hypothetical protein HKX48_005212 [Thoreauomyces humboldtii]